MKRKNYIIGGLFALGVGLSACSDSFLEPEITSVLDGKTAAATAAKNPDVFLSGMWSWTVSTQMSGVSGAGHDDFGIMSVLHSTDLMGEDIALSGLHWFMHDYAMKNNLELYRRTRANWTCFYTMIVKANEVLELFPNGAEKADQKPLVGQALAYRSLAYLYLIQLYQHPLNEQGAVNREAMGVPIIYAPYDAKSSAEMAAAKGRNTVGAVLDLIEKDLLVAVEYLNGYKRPKKTYIDQGVANGFLARYYLLTQQWDKAAKAAKAARTGYKIMDQKGLADGFMDINNAEWMWGFDHTIETKTMFASFFAHISNQTPGYGGLGYSARCIDKRLYDQIPANDYRKAWFNGPDGKADAKTAGGKKPYANQKFGTMKDWDMDYIYMRAAEMVLIEAEAYVRLGQTDQAVTTLKELMIQRVPDWNQTTITLDDVLLQRRIELWGEGFVYFDLKRLNKGFDRSYEGSNHPPTHRLKVEARDSRWVYALPRTEIDENPLISEKEQNK